MPLLASGRWNNSSVLTRLKTTAILYQKEKLQLDFLKNICLKYKQHNFLTHIIIIFRPVTLKWGSVKFDIRKMLCTFSFGCFQIHQNKSPKIIAINFIRTIVPIKYMPKISAVGLFCLYKFENNQTRTCTTFFRMSKLNEPYFKGRQFLQPICYFYNMLNPAQLNFCLWIFIKLFAIAIQKY